jgi:hypothetical protein
MDNGTSIRGFNCLTAGSKGMSRDIGALLPNVNLLTRDVGAPTGNVETSTTRYIPAAYRPAHAGMILRTAPLMSERRT